MSLSHVVIQVAVLAVACGVLGILCGRYLWPRRAPTGRLTPAGATHDLEPALADVEARLRASESQLEQLRRAVAQVSPRSP